MSCHNLHLQSNCLLCGCRLGQDSSPLDAVTLQRNTTGEEHSGGTEEAMLNTHKSMNKTLQELPQHSGLDACFPHALWPINFLSQLQCCTASTRSMSLPFLPLSEHAEGARKRDRSLSLGFRSKWHYFTRREPKTGHVPSFMCPKLKIWAKARLQETQVQVCLLPGHTWSHCGLILQRTIIWRICLLISERRNHLPNISSMCIFLRGRMAENMNTSSTWAVSARKYLSHEDRAMPCCPTSSQAALSEDC